MDVKRKMLKSDRLHTCAEKIHVQCPRFEHGSKGRLRERPQPSGRQIENKIEITLQRNKEEIARLGQNQPKDSRGDPWHTRSETGKRGPIENVDRRDLRDLRPSDK